MNLVIGGELVSLDRADFREPSKVEVTGVFEDYGDAISAWRGRAQSTVDNALMRFFVVPLPRSAQ